MSTKLSDLTQVGDAQDGDLIYIVRGGNSRAATFPPIGPGIFNVKNYGASGNGQANDSAAFAAAIAALILAGGGTLYAPAGNYLLNGNVPLYSYMRIVGDGPDATKFTLLSNANTDVILGDQANSLIGSGSSAGIVYFGLEDFSIDGNKSNNSAGGGIVVYGRRFWVKNVVIRNCVEDGWYSEWSASSASPDSADPLMEAFIDGLEVAYCNGNGIHFNGPHDSMIKRSIAALNNHNHNSTNSGVRIGANAGGALLDAVHSWGDDQEFAFRVDADTCICANCYADGGHTTLVRVQANRFQWIGGRVFGGFITTFTATGGGASTVTLPASSGTQFNSYTPYVGCYACITSGTGSGQGKLITGYDSGSHVVTVTSPWVTPPDATSVVAIIPAYRTTIKGFDLGPTGSVFNTAIRTVVDDAPGAALALTNFGGFSSSIYVVGGISSALQLTGVSLNSFTGSVPTDLAEFFLSIDGAASPVAWRVANTMEPATTNLFGLGTSTRRWAHGYFSNAALHLADTDASHYLTLAAGSNITADRILTLTTGDADRTVTLSGNPTLSDWFDQSVKAAASPQFAAVEVGHATDTTLSRASAGVISVEGVTIARFADHLGNFAATTSAQLAGVISDETGSGKLVFATGPTLTNSIAISGTPSDGVFSRYSADAFGPSFYLEHSRNASVGSHTVVQSGDSVGNFIFQGSDGAVMRQAAVISGAVDGTPGSSDMPGRLVFSTTRDGAVSSTECFRLDNQGMPIFTPGSATPATLGTNGMITLTLTSNTNLRISARGSDGTTRVVNLTLA
jgi:hypothetical protein